MSTSKLLQFALSFTFGLWASSYLTILTITTMYASDDRPSLSISVDSFKVPGPESLCSTSTDDVLMNNRQGGPINYIESSGEECLTPRQACGIESAARANPLMDINVYTNIARLGRPAWDNRLIRHGRVRSCSLNRLLTSNEHRFGRRIQFIRQNFDDWLPKFNSTFKSHHFEEMKKSPHWIVQLSDVARLVLLEKFGGIYLDFDNIVFRPLHCLRNTLSYLQEELNIENGIMIMDSGHPFLKFLLEYGTKNYDPNNRISLGPSTFGKAFKLFCKEESKESLFKAGNSTCNHANVNLIHPDAFFPIKHNQNAIFYSTDLDAHDSFKMPMERAYMTHVYLSSWGTKVDPKSLYARLARHYCPSVWKWSVEGDNIPLKF